MGKSNSDRRQEIYLNSLDGYVPYRGNVLIKPISKEGATTKTGIIVGFEPDAKYVEEEGSHIADMTITEGDIIALPLHDYNEGYKIADDVKAGDHVWFSYFASIHGTDIWVGRELYRLIPYSGMVASMRDGEIRILNGYVLLEEVMETERWTGFWAPAHVMKDRGIVRFMGGKRDYDHVAITDDIDIAIGDEVLLRKGCHVIAMERQKYLATFDGGDKMYRRVKRSDIMAVLSSFETN